MTMRLFVRYAVATRSISQRCDRRVARHPSERGVRIVIPELTACQRIRPGGIGLQRQNRRDGIRSHRTLHFARRPGASRFTLAMTLSTTRSMSVSEAPVRATTVDLEQSGVLRAEVLRGHRLREHAIVHEGIGQPRGPVEGQHVGERVERIAIRLRDRGARPHECASEANVRAHPPRPFASQRGGRRAGRPLRVTADPRGIGPKYRSTILRAAVGSNAPAMTSVALFGT